MAIDKGFGADTMALLAAQPMMESGRERTRLEIQKWDDDQTAWMYRKMEYVPKHVTIPGSSFLRFGVMPYEVFTYHGNLITNAGWNLFLRGKTILSTDTAPTVWFDATHGRIGIGTNTTPAAAATDTGLGSVTGMTGNNWKLCGAAPTFPNGTSSPWNVVFTATFGASDAVGAWNEFAIDQGTASAGPVITATAPMINHSVNIGAGTKAGGTWTATATLTFT